MKVLVVALIAICAFSSCQHEPDDVLPDDNNNNNSTTDTSAIARVTKIGHAGSVDTIIYTFKNNTIAGVKGYIINTKGEFYNFINDGKDGSTKFIYNTAGHLTAIDQQYLFNGVNTASKWEFLWNNTLLTKIKYTEGSYLLMDRPINYSNLLDTLIIKMRSDYHGPIGDYKEYTIFTNNNWSKIHRINSDGVLVDNSNGHEDYHVEEKMEYAGNNLVKLTSKQKSVGTNTSFNNRTDSFVVNFTRISQSGDFWYDLENKILGKELRVLASPSYWDSTTVLFEQFFNFSGEYMSPALENVTQPCSGMVYSSKTVTDGIVTAQYTNQTVNFTCTFDSQNRIRTVKTFDPVTNQLLYETIIEYF